MQPPPTQTQHSASNAGTFLGVLQDANAPAVGVDVDGAVTLWNKKVALITGFPAAEVVGQPLPDFVVGESYRDAVEHCIALAVHDCTSTAEVCFPLRTASGRNAQIVTSFTPLLSDDGTPLGVYGIGQEVTERSGMGMECRKFVDSVNAPIFVVDLESRVVILNKKAAETSEYLPEEIVGASLLDTLISEEFRPTIKTVLQNAFEGAETANVGLPLLTKSGCVLETLLDVAPRYDHLGNLCGAIGIGKNMSDKGTEEQEYARLVETANTAIFGVDKEFRVNIWNPKAAQVTEYSVFDMLGANPIDIFVPEEYRKDVGAVLSAAVEGVETANFTFPLVTRSGRRLEILLNATPRYDENGAIIGVVGFGHEITDRIAYEQEYSRQIETANALIFGVNVDGLVNIWNKKAVEVTQYAPSEVVGENLAQNFIMDDYKEAVAQMLYNTLNGIETANFEFPLITKAGRRVDIVLSATPRFNERGEVIGMVGIGQDITDRTAHEQECIRLMDTANAPIFGVDVNGCVNIWNKKVAEITQYAQSDVLGEKLVDKFITEDYKEAVAQVMTKALDGVETANFAFPLITKTGRRVEIMLNATSRFNEHGKVIGMIGVGQDITGRVAQEEEYNRLIDIANAPIFGVDANGCVKIWNRKAAEITRFTPDEVLGEDFICKFIEEEYRDAVAEALSRTLQGDEETNFEVPLNTKTGLRVIFLVNATARFDQHGRCSCVVAIGQDITERTAQEQEYSRLIDTANAPIFGVDANMCVNIWNKKAAQITCYSIHEAMGENLADTFVSPEFRPLVAEVFAKALQGIQTANFEFPLITRLGTRIEILLNATPRMDSNGSIVGVVGIGQDITDRIAQEHEYFRLIDTANAPIFGVDTNGCINEWNQKIEAITGYHKSSVLGLSLINTLIVPESRLQVSQLLNQALIGIDVGEMELPMTTKKGVFLLLLVNASSKKDMHGNIRGVIGVGQDYTAKKRMEQAKMNFLASFSHELRTPLNGVLGMLELLKEQKLDSVSQRYVHIGYVSGSLLLNLINDILDLSKIEAGHMEISSVPFHMHDLLDYSIEIFNLKARERGLILEQQCDGDVPNHVIGDIFRLRQVLLNLLSNAVKFTNSGSIIVSCSKAKSNDLPVGFVKLLFQVMDTGIGMDAEEKSHLFSLFTKLERTRQNNPTGSGLGLAICKQLVELMGGSIGVESALDVGSNFYFTVVVQLVEEEEGRQSSLFGSDYLIMSSTGMPTGSSDVVSNNSNPGAAPSGSMAVVPAKARILVVEDNDFNWEVFKCFLQEDDHLLQWEMNGRNAVNAYIQNHTEFDLIFMDCEMPVMDGYTATMMIRQFEQETGLPRIPILGLTAYAMNGDRQKCLDAGMDEFMVKPIAKMSLRRAIRHRMKVRYLVAPAVALSAPVISLSTVSTSPEHNKAFSNTPMRDSIDKCAAPSYRSTTLGVRAGGQSADARSGHVTPPKSTRLVPASQHIQQLDLTRAIANLELDDPMAVNRRGGLPIRTATPTTSIFSLNTPLSTNQMRSSSGSLPTFQRDASGAIVEVADLSPKDKTSSTLPTGKSYPLYHPDLNDEISVKRASYPKTPMIWNQQLMKPVLTSTIGTATMPPRPSEERFNHRETGSSTDEDHEGNVMPPSLLGGQSPRSEEGIPLNDQGKTESFLSMSPLDVMIPEGDPVNYALGVEQCGDCEELFLNLLEKFTMGCEAAMTRIEDAYLAEDFGLLKQESHSLKGSSAYVAALRVSKSAYRVQLASERAIERQAGSADINQALVEMIALTMATLRKEHKLLRGYIQRNFAFHSMRNSVLKDDRSREKQANACGLM